MKSLQILIISILIWNSLVNCTEYSLRSKKGNEYYIQDEQKYTWQEAYNECEKENKDLLIIDSPEKADEIKDLLMDIFSPQPIPRFYLSAHDLHEEKNFKWITRTESKPFTYTNWEPKEPNNYQNLNERCVHLGYHGTDQWNDIRCDRKYGYICQERENILFVEKF